jgi:hypothetical protein
MMHFVCGLSRSGKTRMIERVIASRPAIAHLSARAILTANARPTASLDISGVIANQEILARAINCRVGDLSETWILDGHAMIETSAGPVLVPDSFFLSLSLATVTFVDRSIEDIAFNRGDGEANYLAELHDLTNIELSAARRVARRIGAKFSAINSNDVEGLLAAIDSSDLERPTSSDN